MNTSEFASAGLTAGQLNAIVKKLGGHEMALRFLRNELIVSESPKPSILEMIGEVVGVFTVPHVAGAVAVCVK